MGTGNEERLILVVAAYFPDSYGGAERQAQILAEALGRLAVDVTLVAPSTWDAAPEQEPTSFGRIVRYKVSAYPNAGGRHITSFLAWTWWFRRRFAHEAADGVPIYVFHARLHAFGPSLLAAQQGSPLLIKLGGGGDASDFAALRAKRFLYGRWIQSFLLRHVDRFVANSGQIVQDLEALGVASERIAAFPNGVVLPPVGQLHAALKARNGNKFLYTGRLVPDKRVDVLLAAAASLLSQGRRMTLRLVGDGSARDALQEAARHGGICEDVSFPGFVNDVYPELMAADFFVSASMREGQSNSLLEAMSAGVIPIVFAASGASDVVAHGVNGFVVDQSSPDAFAKAMDCALSLSHAARQEMAMAARSFAEDHIGIDAIAERTLQMMREIRGVSKVRSADRGEIGR